MKYKFELIPLCVSVECIKLFLGLRDKPKKRALRIAKPTLNKVERYLAELCDFYENKNGKHVQSDFARLRQQFQETREEAIELARVEYGFSSTDPDLNRFTKTCDSLEETFSDRSRFFVFSNPQRADDSGVAAFPPQKQHSLDPSNRDAIADAFSTFQVNITGNTRERICGISSIASYYEINGILNDFPRVANHVVLSDSALRPKLLKKAFGIVWG